MPAKCTYGGAACVREYKMSFMMEVFSSQLYSIFKETIVVNVTIASCLQKENVSSKSAKISIER
jgi:hypothetical protein